MSAGRDVLGVIPISVAEPRPLRPIAPLRWPPEGRQRSPGAQRHAHRAAGRGRTRGCKDDVGRVEFAADESEGHHAGDRAPPALRVL